jgi:hypothetical protein
MVIFRCKFTNSAISILAGRLLLALRIKLKIVGLIRKDPGEVVNKRVHSKVECAVNAVLKDSRRRRADGTTEDGG